MAQQLSRTPGIIYLYLTLCFVGRYDADLVRLSVIASVEYSLSKESSISERNSCDESTQRKRTKASIEEN